MRLAVTGARRNPARTATTTVALTIGIGLMTLFSVVLSTASQFATHEMNRNFPADYMLSVKATFSGGVLDETAIISWTDFTRILGPGKDTTVLVKARLDRALRHGEHAVPVGP